MPEIMTRSRWLERVSEHKEALRQLIADYHPSSNKKAPPMVITAPSAEAACETIRTEIRAKESGDPVEWWDKAVVDGDVSTLNNLLNGAWFGVPESTECWDIPGFAVACALMDDLPPEADEEES